MVVIPVSEAEKAARALTTDHREAAVRAVREDGFVVLEGVVPLNVIDRLRERTLADVELLLARKDRPFNWNAGNLQQDPARDLDLIFPEVLVNDLVIDVTHGVLGDGVKSAFYSGNTALKSEERQPVHADMGQLWQGQPSAHPAYALVVNLPLVDMGPENGSTEIWPGTHLDPTVAMQDGLIEASEEAKARWAAIHPPFQPEVKAGSVVIRDIRMWHAGMPNRTDAPRPMIAMIHWVSWWPTGPIQMPKGSEPIFEHPRLFTHAEFVDGPIDHISAPGAHAFSDDEERA